MSTRVAGFVHVEDSGKMVTVKPERSTRRMSFGAVRVAGVSDEDEDEEDEIEISWDWTVEPVRSVYGSGKNPSAENGDRKIDSARGELSRVRAQYHAETSRTSAAAFFNDVEGDTDTIPETAEAVCQCSMIPSKRAGKQRRGGWRSRSKGG